MNPSLQQFGLHAPTYPELVSAAAALLIVAMAAALAILAGRKLGPPLSRFWERQVGERSEGIARRMCDLVRHLVAALVLAIGLNADRWPLLSAVLLAVPLALAWALFLTALVRGVQLPRWLAWALGTATFIAIFAKAIGGLDPVMEVLDRVGFSAGHYRFSLLRLVQIMIGLAVLLAAVRLAGRVITHSIRHSKSLDPTQQLLAQKLSSVALLVIAFLLAIDLAGIDLTALAVFSGAFGLAVGFGLQKTIGNLIAGIILLMDRSIKPGDVIVIGGSVGSVNKIGVRAVSIVTRDGKEHLIPNENLMTQEVENWSYSSPNIRIHIPVGVSYDCDIALAQKLMIEAAMEPQRVLKTPKPSVWLRGFGESSVNHEILLWIADPEAGLGNIQSEVLNRVWVLFKEHDIALPYPQRDIHVKDWPSAVRPAGLDPASASLAVAGRKKMGPGSSRG